MILTYLISTVDGLVTPTSASDPALSAKPPASPDSALAGTAKKKQTAKPEAFYIEAKLGSKQVICHSDPKFKEMRRRPDDCPNRVYDITPNLVPHNFASTIGHGVNYVTRLKTDEKAKFCAKKYEQTGKLFTCKKYMVGGRGCYWIWPISCKGRSGGEAMLAGVGYGAGQIGLAIGASIAVTTVAAPAVAAAAGLAGVSGTGLAIGSAVALGGAVALEHGYNKNKEAQANKLKNVAKNTIPTPSINSLKNLGGQDNDPFFKVVYDNTPKSPEKETVA
jgi:hypothetical protein